MRRQSSAGWLLVGLIVLISAVILALVGITFYLTEHLRTTSLRQNQTRAIYLAQAGVMQAIYDFRFDGPGGVTVDGNNFRLGEYDAVPPDTGSPGLADDDVFILGGEADDFLLAVMIPATFAPPPEPGAGGACGGTSRDRLGGWTLRNVLLSNIPPNGMPISFNQVTVTWDPVSPSPPNPIERVVRLDFNGTGVTWRASPCPPPLSTDPGAPGVPITLLSTQTISPGTQWGTNRVWFSTTTMDTKAWIEIAFTMTDGSVRRVRYIPPLASPPQDVKTSSANFTIKSVGEVRQGVFPFSVWRRIQAEYRLNDNDTTMNLQEIGNITTDGKLVIAPAVPPADERPGYRELSQKTP